MVTAVNAETGEPLEHVLVCIVVIMNSDAFSSDYVVLKYSLTRDRAGRVRVRLDGGNLEIDVKPVNLRLVTEHKGTWYPAATVEATSCSKTFIFIFEARG